MIYEWKHGSHLSHVDAQAAGEQLEEIRQMHGGLTADIVVKAAEPEHSALHPAFEWDDQTAAGEYRKVQAREVLRMIVVRQDEQAPEESARAFVVVNIDGDDLYTSTAVAMSDAELRRQVLARALKELDAWQRRYHEIEELAQMFGQIEREREALMLTAGEARPV